MSVGAVNKQTGDRIPTAGMPAIDNALSAISTNPVQNAVITAALAGKQDTLTFDDVPTDGSNNPVKSNGIYDALALKQDKTDNSLQTTDKTIPGAINEVKSGLIDVDVALSVPDGTGKNLLAIPDYENTYSGVTYTINNTAIQVVGTADGNSYFTFYSWNQLKDTFLASYAGQKVKISSTSDDVRFTLAYRKDSSSSASEYNVYNGETELTLPSDTTYQIYLAFRVLSGVTINTVIYPMIRPASVSDPTFAPYIPSVESRIEAVESGLDNKVRALVDGQLAACKIISFVDYTDDNAYNVWTGHNFTVSELTKIVGVFLCAVNSDPTQYRHEVELTGISNNLFTYAVKGGWSGGVSGVYVICIVIGI